MHSRLCRCLCIVDLELFSTWIYSKDKGRHYMFVKYTAWYDRPHQPPMTDSSIKNRHTNKNYIN